MTNLLLCFAFFVLISGGFFLLLRKNLIHNLMGLGLLGNGVNLALLILGQRNPGLPPLIGDEQSTLSPFTADPVPQALILTAIVIGFGMISYFAAVLHQGREHFRTQEEASAEMENP